MSRRITEFSMMVAVAFLFSYLESIIPLPIPMPGIKLGLANLVILIYLYRSGLRDAFLVSIIRNVLTAVTFGNLFMFFYSMAGSILSLSIMGLLYRSVRTSPSKNKKSKHLSILTVSTIGGIFHNMGQLIVAIFVLQSTSLIHYFPFLYFGGMVSGLLIGFISYHCLNRLPSINNMN